MGKTKSCQKPSKSRYFLEILTDYSIKSPLKFASVIYTSQTIPNDSGLRARRPKHYESRGADDFALARVLGWFYSAKTMLFAIFCSETYK